MIKTDTGVVTTQALPPELHSPRAKLVYLYLSTNEQATVTEMASALGMKKLSLYSILKTLREDEYVKQRGETYRLTSPGSEPIGRVDRRE